MLHTLAIAGYRSLHDIVLPMSQLTVITGENGSGKSNLYKSLRLISAAAEGRIVGALAHEGGIPSTLWAGPEQISRAMKQGAAIQGGPNRNPVRLKLGFAADPYSYLIELGLAVPAPGSLFNLDPEIKRECVFVGDAWRQASTLVDRQGPLLKRREKKSWTNVTQHLSAFDTVFAAARDPQAAPEIVALLHYIQSWRFYDEFRTDQDAPVRRSWPATRTTVLSSDGRDLAAALQTIIEIGDNDALEEAIDDAFPGAKLVIAPVGSGQLELTFEQPGLLRGLQISEWSDGTLQYVLLVAALLSPRPPPLLIRNVSEHSQVWVITHANRLVNGLSDCEHTTCLHLIKEYGQSQIYGLSDQEIPVWRWP